MTKRFILIDSNSGFVWGEAVAADIVAACKAVDADISSEERTYEELGRDPRDTSGYYTVYDASGANLPRVEDGQDRGAIAAVAALPVAGWVRSSAVEA